MESKKSLTTEQLEDAKRLKALYESKKKELKVTQYTIADDLGITQGAVGHFMNGRNALNVEVAAGFAKVLNVSVSDFSPSLAAKIASQAEGLTSDVIEYAGKLRSGSIPVVGEAILGVDGMIDMVEVKAGWLQIYSSDKDAYGLRVKGDSMYPRIQSGEFVVIEPNTPVHSGDEVFVRTRDGHNMIKVMTKTRDGGFQFSSINNEHKPITVDHDGVEKMHYVAAIVKGTRYVDYDDVSPKVFNGLNITS
ncbi:LexA family transcriptional regulator [Yokenella regensburgei]|uniref:LexA family transcriptional regulator n=1 Tax=Yokenella regensburgei TaxID=158877 RepID=UPI0014329878|nr:XRE family transcriptional regulator [Yokenella regensburgei]QIU92118.1 helix-turn-helix domain-containing protein [Yokenella regensburgei]